MDTARRGEPAAIVIEVERTTVRRRVIVRRCGGDHAPSVVEGEVVVSQPVRVTSNHPARPAISPPPSTLPGTDLLEPPVNLLNVLCAVGNDEPATAVLGVLEDNTPLLLRLTAEDVGNVLITGGAGAGKATLLRTLTLSLALRNHPARLQIAGVDPQGRALAILAALPHLLAPPATQPAAIDALVRRLAQALDTRHTGTSPLEPCIIIAVHDVAGLIGAVGPLVVGDLVRLAREGNPAGIHLVCSEAQPECLPAELLACFPVRLVGRTADVTAAHHAAGRGDTEAEWLTGAGDFLAVTAAESARFWAAACSPLEIPRIIAALTGPTQAPSQLLQ